MVEILYARECVGGYFVVCGKQQAVCWLARVAGTGVVGGTCETIREHSSTAENRHNTARTKRQWLYSISVQYHDPTAEGGDESRSRGGGSKEVKKKNRVTEWQRRWWSRHVFPARLKVLRPCGRSRCCGGSPAPATVERAGLERHCKRLGSGSCSALAWVGSTVFGTQRYVQVRVLGASRDPLSGPWVPIPARGSCRTPFCFGQLLSRPVGSDGRCWEKRVACLRSLPASEQWATASRKHIVGTHSRAAGECR